MLALLAQHGPKNVYTHHAVFDPRRIAGSCPAPAGVGNNLDSLLDPDRWRTPPRSRWTPIRSRPTSHPARWTPWGSCHSHPTGNGQTPDTGDPDGPVAHLAYPFRGLLDTTLDASAVADPDRAVAWPPTIGPRTSWRRRRY